VRGSAGETLTARAEALGARFRPRFNRNSFPKGVASAMLEDVTRSTSTEVKAGEDVPLRPGDYRLKVGGEGGLRIPFLVPFAWRESGRDPAKETPRTVGVPMAPADLPADRALVVPVGETVDHRGPPFGPQTLPATVGPFLMDRYEVSSEYLGVPRGPQGGRRAQARAPAAGFDADPDRRRTSSSSPRATTVRGISRRTP
jgi:hypothetical protein